MSPLPTRILGVATALALGGAWLGTALGCAWPLEGYVGTAAGVAVGFGVCLGNRHEPSMAFAALAPLLAAAGLIGAVALQQAHQQAQAKAAVESDASLIAAIAEQVMLERFVAGPQQGEAVDFRSPPPGVEFAASYDSLPDEVRQEANRRWQALSEAEKQMLRQQRDQRVAASHGAALDRIGPGILAWQNLVAYAVAAVVALAVAGLPVFLEYTANNG